MTNRKFDPGEAHKLSHPDRKDFESPDLIWKTLKLDNPGVVVDIGAGMGYYSIPFSRKMEKGIVYACDFSEVMLEKLREKTPSSLQKKIVPVKNEEISIPLDSSIADLVFMANLHHELDNPHGMIRESLRLLKKGGTLAIIDLEVVESPFGPPLHKRVPGKLIAEQLNKAGLIDIQEHDILDYQSFVTGRKA